LLNIGGPWAPFENSWHLREDYKKVSKRKELAQALSKRILRVGIANLVLCPVIFLWQILYSFFNYAEVSLFRFPKLKQAYFKVYIYILIIVIRLLKESLEHWELDVGQFMDASFFDISMSWNIK